MGWLSQVGHAVTHTLNPIKAFQNPNQMKQDAGGLISAASGINPNTFAKHPFEQMARSMTTGTILQPVGDQVGNAFKFLDKKPGADAPTDPTAESIKNAQLKNAKDFRAGLPGMENQMANDLTQQASEGVRQGVQNAKESDNSRGLLYGGMNQGHQQQVRAQGRAGLAKAIQSSNMGLEDAANKLDQQAVNSAYGVQQQQQQIQNSVYQQALAQMMAQNTVIGGAMSGGSQVAGMFI